MAATIWKGQIEFGKVHVPVRFHSAVEDRSIHFNLLHARDETRVKQVMVNGATGEPVPTENIRRGFEVSNDAFVFVEDAELEKLAPKESRTIRVERFVPNEQINHQWYERPYLLSPDTDGAEYFALVEALGDNKLEGVARWAMRKRAYVGSLQASHGYLMMITLRTADEVIPVSSLPKPAGRPLDKKELALAGQLINALEGTFDPNRYHDEYRERLMEFIQAKAKGRKPKLRLVRPPKTTAPDHLIKVLAASVKSLRKGA